MGKLLYDVKVQYTTSGIVQVVAENAEEARIKAQAKVREHDDPVFGNRDNFIRKDFKITSRRGAVI